MVQGSVQLAGFFTRQIGLQGQTLAEIERRLGFDRGRLSQGAWFATALELPKEDGFELAGYSQVASHHTVEQYGNINSPQTNDQKAAYQQQKKNVIASWKLTGSDRLIKVIPMIGHSLQMGLDYQYPPGSGLPQWKITKPILCKGICFVSDYPDGRFIPEQGYHSIKYF
jgi:hypothetical protein